MSVDRFEANAWFKSQIRKEPENQKEESVGKNSLSLIDTFTMEEKLRTNKIKFVHISDFIQVYVASGTTRDGQSKHGNFRLHKRHLKKLKEWLNEIEL